MGAFAVELAPRAAHDLEGLSSDVSRRIETRLLELEEHPFPRGDTIKRLQGTDPAAYRFRVGDYRAIFRILGRVVRILRVVHRSDLERAIQDLV